MEMFFTVLKYFVFSIGAVLSLIGITNIVRSNRCKKASENKK